MGSVCSPLIFLRKWFIERYKPNKAAETEGCPAVAVMVLNRFNILEVHRALDMCECVCVSVCVCECVCN